MDDRIDLKPYLDTPTREAVAALYLLHKWELVDATHDWRWPFLDVCALYFRVVHHSDAFGTVTEATILSLSIRAAIYDYMGDEFA